MLLDQYWKPIRTAYGDVTSPMLSLCVERFVKVFSKDLEWAGFGKVADLRRSCGVIPDGKDTITIRKPSLTHGQASEL